MYKSVADMGVSGEILRDRTGHVGDKSARAYEGILSYVPYCDFETAVMVCLWVSRSAVATYGMSFQDRPAWLVIARVCKRK